MKDELYIALNKISLMVGIPTLIGGYALADWDLMLAVTLKIVSIISFLIFASLNLLKLIEKFKSLWKKKQ